MNNLINNLESEGKVIVNVNGAPIEFYNDKDDITEVEYIDLDDYEANGFEVTGIELKKINFKNGTMTKEECERQVAELVKEIDRIINEYNPGNGYWVAGISDDGCISFNNKYWEEKNKPVNYFEELKGGDEE